MKISKVYISSFVLSLLSIIFFFFLFSFYPFGNKASLFWDMDIQYLDYFYWFKGVLQGENALIYSFSKSLGGNMIGLFAYYLSSPLNMLLVFFEKENVLDFLSLIIWLKIALAGLTFSIYLKHRFFLSDGVVIGLSVSYALMQYNITQFSNIMWLDGVFWLPIVCLGIYKFINTKTNSLFYLSLTLTILSNWYIGYMVCIFSFIYFLYESYLNNSKINMVKQLKLSFQFLLSGITSVLTSCILLWPVIIELRQGKGTFDLGFLLHGERFPFLEIIKGLLIGGYYKEELPALFVGTIVLIYTIAYFISSKINNKEKTITGIVLLLLLGSTWLIPVESIWNGFRMVYSYYCRFSFVISFFIITIAARYLEQVGKNIDLQDYKRLLYIVGGLIIAVGFIDWFDELRCHYLVYVSTLWVGVFLYFIKKRKKYFELLFVLFICVDLFLNAVPFFSTMDYIDAENTKMYETAIKNDLESIDDSDSFYRVEKTYSRLSIERPIYSPANNESLAYGYKGLSHYSSTQEQKTMELLQYMGYSKVGKVTVDYKFPIIAADSLLGISYCFSENQPMGYEKTEKDNLYINPFSLPLGYMIDDDFLQHLEYNDDPFLFQNAFISAILGEEIKIYEPLAVDKKIVEEQTALWQVGLEKDKYYGYISSDGLQEDCKLYFDGTLFSHYLNWFNHFVFPIEDENISSISLKGNLTKEQLEKLNLQLYKMNTTKLKTVVDSLSVYGFTPKLIKDGHVSGTYFTSKEGLLLLTIPYDKGWKVKVNNDYVEIKDGNGLMVVPVVAGDNKIECNYHLPGAISGFLLCLLGVIGQFIIFRKNRTIRRNKND